MCWSPPFLKGGLSALGAALTTLGVHKDQAIKYETALTADKYVLVVHGDAADAARADEGQAAPSTFALLHRYG